MGRSEIVGERGRAVGCEMQGARREARRLARWTGGLGRMVLVVGLLAFWDANGWSDVPPIDGGHHHHPVATPAPKTTPEATPATQHPHPGTPKGWQFALPSGDPQAGRQVFTDLECFKCHEVVGENFPAPKAEQGDVGSMLSGMGGMHPAEYFAEIMIDPNASVAWRIKHHKSEKKGYLGPDGKSKMPSYNDTMTIQQLIDIVAYMKSLTAGGHQH